MFGLGFILTAISTFILYENAFPVIRRVDKIVLFTATKTASSWSLCQFAVSSKV